MADEFDKVPHGLFYGNKQTEEDPFKIKSGSGGGTTIEADMKTVKDQWDMFIDKEAANLVLDTMRATGELSAFELGLRPGFNENDSFNQNLINVTKLGLTASLGQLGMGIFYAAAGMPGYDAQIGEVAKSIHIGVTKANALLGNYMEERNPASEASRRSAVAGINQYAGKYGWGEDVKDITMGWTNLLQGYGLAYQSQVANATPALELAYRLNKDNALQNDKDVILAKLTPSIFETVSALEKLSKPEVKKAITGGSATGDKLYNKIVNVVSYGIQRQLENSGIKFNTEDGSVISR